METKHKSGFVSVIGRPNVGKSTLINQVVGEKIAIVSNKPQTTRNRILSIYKDEESQIVFVDTPGIHQPKNKLGTFMVKSALSSLEEIDLVLYIVDVTKDILQEDLLNRLQQCKCKVLLLFNKIDLIEKSTLLHLMERYRAYPFFDAMIPISAEKADGIDVLIGAIKERLPEGPCYFPDDMITDQPEKQIVSEMIREKMLRYLSQEIPHGIAVAVEQMKYEREDTFCRIHAVIYAEKASHKQIIIGKGGSMLKKIGTAARLEIERFLQCKVHLDLWVRVKEDWRNNGYLMKNFGFEEDF